MAGADDYGVELAEETPDFPEELKVPVGRLGTPDAVHRHPETHLVRPVLYGCSLIALSGVLCFLYFTFIGLAFFEKFVFVILFGPMVFGIVIIRRALRYAGLWVLRFPMGLLRWQRSNLITITWDDIHTLRFDGYDGNAAAVLHYREGETLPMVGHIPMTGGFNRWKMLRMSLAREEDDPAEFPSTLTQFVELAETAQQETFPRLFQDAWTNYTELGFARFGPMRISADGVEGDGLLIGWGRFSHVLISNGQLSFWREDELKAALDVPMADVPNPHVVIGMVLSVYGQAVASRAIADEGDGELRVFG
jgi:hypothetical protein